MRNLSLFLLGAMSIVAIGCSDGPGNADLPDVIERPDTHNGVTTDCEKFEKFNITDSATLDQRVVLESSSEDDKQNVRVMLVNEDGSAAFNLRFSQTEEEIQTVEPVKNEDDDTYAPIETEVRIEPNTSLNKSYKASLLEKDIKDLFADPSESIHAGLGRLIFQIDTISDDAEEEVQSCTVTIDNM